MEYEKNLNIPKIKEDKIRESKDKLRERICGYLKDKHPEYKPEFYIQGSYKMRTTILTKDKECDLDYGIYFNTEVDITSTTLQRWVKNALDGATSSLVEHRSKCLRVIYKQDYHIDFPVYIFPEKEKYPFLAVKDSDFEMSDPKGLIKWYVEEKSKNQQLNRIVKYLKGWGDHKRNKMPSGLAMSILAANNIQANDRDDLSLKDTLIEIQKILNNNFKCIVPVMPYDDLFENYNDVRKDNFLSNLSNFIEDAQNAVYNEPNQLQASKLWCKHLGPHFPSGENEDIDKKEKELRQKANIILGGKAYSQPIGIITADSSGVKNKPHTNYHGSKFDMNKSKSGGKYRTFLREKSRIESKYAFLKCVIYQQKGKKMKCKGVVKPTEYSVDYTIRINCDGHNPPKVYVINPKIEYSDDIHLYKDGSLCLYHEEKDSFYWDYKKHSIYDTIIPWTLEWFIFYELYLITGKWEHPFVSHKTIGISNPPK